MPPESSSSPHAEDGPHPEGESPKVKALKKALRPLARWSKWRQAALRQERRDAKRELRAASAADSDRRRGNPSGA